MISFQKEEKEHILLKKATDVILSFKDIRDKLQIIGRKIDGIKPKLDEYINNINQQDFYRKFKLFLKYTLDNIQINKSGEIRLPDNISNECVPSSRLQKFIIIKDNWNPEQLLVQRTIKISIPSKNKEASQQELKKSNDYNTINNCIMQYINEL